MAQDRGLIFEQETPDTVGETGKNHLLAIGINAYAHITPLKNAVKDAQDLATMLEQHYQFLPEHICLITDAEATESRIFAEFRRLIQQVGPDDNVVIFFSGHGQYDDVFKDGFWIPVDAEAGKMEDYIANSRISKTIENIDSRHTLLIADACFSGTLFGESRSVFSKENATRYHQKVGSIPSRWGLTSGRNEIVSDGAAGGNSPFTENLLMFFQSHQDAPFSVSDLVQYVKTTTANNAQQTPIGSPLRNVGDKGGELIFFPTGTAAQTYMQPVAKPAQQASAFRAEAPATSQSPDPNAAGPLGKSLTRWIKGHPQMLVLIALSAIFWGLWNSWLFAVVPILAFGILGVTAFFKLQGRARNVSIMGICLIAVVEFVRSDWERFSQNCWETFADNGEAWSCFLESIGSRTDQHQFLWFALGLASFVGFLYLFFKEKK